MAMLPQTEDARPLQQLRKSLADSGFQEVINFAFVEEAWKAIFAPMPPPSIGQSDRQSDERHAVVADRRTDR